MATKTLEQIDASLTRWKSRLRRAMTAIDKLEKQRKRLANKATVRVSVPAHPTVDSETTLGAVPPKPEPKPAEWSAANPIADDIPAFLRRQSSPSPVAEQIKAEIEEKKKAKARGRIATMKAKKSGETKRMPLTGKAALAAIRSAE
jgi:hypothetical protein